VPFGIQKEHFRVDTDPGKDLFDKLFASGVISGAESGSPPKTGPAELRTPMQSTEHFRTVVVLLLLARAAACSTVLAQTSPVALTNQPATAASATVNETKLADAYGKLPLSFEANQGQTDRRVKFLSRGSGYALFLTGDEAVLALKKGNPERKQSAAVPPAAGKHVSSETTDFLRMRLLGASPAVLVSGVDERAGKSNYFVGNDPAKWQTNVPTYAKVKYEEVYPGINLIYYGNQRQLEYDFVVAPGADPKEIRLRFHGTKSLAIDERGALVLETKLDQCDSTGPTCIRKLRARDA